jgi:hypothetical protein
MALLRRDIHHQRKLDDGADVVRVWQRMGIHERPWGALLKRSRSTSATRRSIAGSFAVVRGQLTKFWGSMEEPVAAGSRQEQAGNNA